MKNTAIEKPTQLYCVDPDGTFVREDGFHLLGRGEATLLIASIAPDPKIIDWEAVNLTIGKGKRHRQKEKRRMYPVNYVSKNNFSAGIPVRSIIAEIKLNRMEMVSTEIRLGTAKIFRYFTHQQVKSFLSSRHTSVFDSIDSIIKNIFQKKKISFVDRKTIPNEELLIQKILWLFNLICKEYCEANNIPYIGHSTKNGQNGKIVTTSDALATFNCPYRHPVATLNNANLVHYLENEIPLLSLEELNVIIQKMIAKPSR